MKTIKFGGHEFELGKFHPCLVYNEELDLLQIKIRDCSFVERSVFSKYYTVDVLEDNHPRRTKKQKIVGFNLWGARKILTDQGYTKSSIPLENLIKRFLVYFDGYKWPAGAPAQFIKYTEDIFKKEALAVAREHQFVWWIPK